MMTAVLKKTDHITAFGYVRMACRRVMARSASVAAYEVLVRTHLDQVSRLRAARLVLWYSLAMKAPQRDELWLSQLAFASLLRFTNFGSDSVSFWTTLSSKSIVLSGLASVDGRSGMAVAML